MSYWCDDEAMRREQEIRDAEQERALGKAAAKGRPWAIQIIEQRNR